MNIRAGLETNLSNRKVRLHVFQQVAPHSGLPCLSWRQCLAAVQHIPPCSPMFQPIGAVVLVAVQYIGQLLRQAKGAAALGVVAEVMGQG